MSDHQEADEKQSTRQQPALQAAQPQAAYNTRSRSSASFTTPSDAAMLSQPLFQEPAETPISLQEDDAVDVSDTRRRLTLAPSRQPTLHALLQSQTEAITASIERGHARMETSLASIASAFTTLADQARVTTQLLQRLTGDATNQALPPTANATARTSVDNQAVAAAQLAGRQLAGSLSDRQTASATPAIPLVVRTATQLVPVDDFKHQQTPALAAKIAQYPEIRDAVNRTRRFMGNVKRRQLDALSSLPAASRAAAQKGIDDYFSRLNQELNDSAEHDVEILNHTQANVAASPAEQESHVQRFIDNVRATLNDSADKNDTVANNDVSQPQQDRSDDHADDSKYEQQQDAPRQRPSQMRPLYELLDEEPTDDSRPPSPAPIHDRDYSFNVTNTTNARRKSRVLDTSAREDKNEGHSDHEIQRLWETFLTSPAGARLAAAKIQRRQLFHETDKSNCNDLNAVLADMEQTIDRYAIPRLHDTQKQSLFIAYFLAPQSTFLDDARKWQRQGLSWATFVHKMQEQHGVTDVILENALAKFTAKYAEDTPRQAYHAFRRHVQALVNARRLKEMSRARPTANAASYTMPPGEYEAHFVRAIERPFENFDVSRYKFFVNWKRDHQAANAQSTGIDHEKRVNWLQLAYEEVQKNDKRQSRNETNDDRSRHDRDRPRYDRSRDVRYPRRTAIAVNNTYPDSDTSDVDDAYEHHSQHFDDYIDGHADEHTPSVHYANTTGSYGPPKHQWMNSFRGQQRSFPQRPTRCMFCSADGHYMADCPLVVRVKQLLVQQPHLAQPASTPTLPLATNQGQQRPHATNSAPRVHFAETNEDTQYDC